MMVLLFLGTTFNSCQKKEDLLEKKQGVNEPQFRRDPKACLTPIKLFCDSILWFNDQAHFDAVYQCLEVAYEAHNEWFDEQTANMTDEEAEEYALSINFDEDKPLIDFENFHQFYSYRKWLADNEEFWIDNGINTLTNDYILNDIKSTLISRSRMVRIGDFTKYYYNDGLIFSIKSDDCSIIKRVLENPFDAMNEFNELITAPKRKIFVNFYCGFLLSDKGKIEGSFNYQKNGERKTEYKFNFYKETISNFDNQQYRYITTGEIKNYKKKNNGNYRKRRISSSVGTFTHLFDSTECTPKNKCSSPIQVYKKRRKRFIECVFPSNDTLFISDKENYWPTGNVFIEGLPNDPFTLILY